MQSNIGETSYHQPGVGVVNHVRESARGNMPSTLGVGTLHTSVLMCSVSLTSHQVTNFVQCGDR
jgi:hypothetical protein